MSNIAVPELFALRSLLLHFANLNPSLFGSRFDHSVQNFLALHTVYETGAGHGIVSNGLHQIVDLVYEGMLVTDNVSRGPPCVEVRM